jgi:hypothetical protein
VNHRVAAFDPDREASGQFAFRSRRSPREPDDLEDPDDDEDEDDDEPDADDADVDPESRDEFPRDEELSFERAGGSCRAGGSELRDVRGGGAAGVSRTRGGGAAGVSRTRGGGAAGA